MTEAEIYIGGRKFRVACESGQEKELQDAVSLLDNEAQLVLAESGQATESQLLLLAGLMVAFQVKAHEGSYRELQVQIRDLESELGLLRARQRSDTELSAEALKADKLRDEIQTKTATLAEIETQLREANSKNDQLAQEIDTLKAAISKREAAPSSNELDALKEQLAQASQDNQALAGSLASSDRKVDALNAQIAARDTKLAEINIDGVKAEYDEKLREREANIDDLNTQLASLQKRLDQAEATTSSMAADESNPIVASLPTSSQIENQDAAPNSQAEVFDVLNEMVGELERIASK